MKSRLLVLAALAAAVFLAGGCALPDYGDDRYPSDSYSSVHVGLYYDDLAPYGHWNYAAQYGWVWTPSYTPIGWRPYTVGYWAYSDWGWMWVAEDPWGGWPYHYGRWAFDSFYGWVWIPDDVWAPAWVSWRYGDGWVGWAPLPPDVSWSVGVGIRLGPRDLDRRIDAYSWCFTPTRDFARQRVRGNVVPVGRNVTLLQTTQNVTKLLEIDSRPVERGLPLNEIERDAGTSVKRFQVSERTTAGGRGNVRVQGRVLEVDRPAPGEVRNANERLRSVAKDVPLERPDRRRTREDVEMERRQFEERATAERQRLASEHDRELRRPPAGKSREAIRREQEAETRAQREAEERGRRVLEERRRRAEEDRANQSDQREERRNRGRGQDRGQGRDRQDRGEGQ